MPYTAVVFSGFKFHHCTEKLDVLKDIVITDQNVFRIGL